MESAARKIRTGEAEKSALTVGGFKSLICAVGHRDRLLESHRDHPEAQRPGAASIRRACVTNSSQTGSSGNSGDALSNYSGTASQVVLVTACYRWPLADSFKFMKFSASGPTIIQAATAFKNEPYN